MDFRELEEFQRIVNSLQNYQVISLEHYHITESCGFRHLYSKNESNKDFSKSSTATCILSLVASGCWAGQNKWDDQTERLALELANTEWTSAKLETNNPFTVSFILESILALIDKHPNLRSNSNIKQKIDEAISILQHSLSGEGENNEAGSAKLANYPASSYLTQLVVRVLQKCEKLDETTRKNSRKWAWLQIEHEFALIMSDSKSADPLSFAYAIILYASCTQPSESTPDENQILQKAIECFFDSQLKDGLWPRSRPLFHYPKVGNAYCFEYEMLTQFLQEKNLIEYSLIYIENLYKATRRLKELSYEFNDGGIGWASGHHPQLQGPESWSTASVYHFLHLMNRIIAEAIRREVFTYVGSEYLFPVDIKREKEFCKNFWDSEIQQSTTDHYSLKEVLLNKFVQPVFDCKEIVNNGHDLPKSVPISAVFFGPPGTSKTELATEISKYLNWPLLKIDPSHLVKEGLDQVQAETNLVFNMLSKLEACVVLLDEFDEMLRERTSAQSETLSRFLTTAMLPKLSQINNRRRIVFIVATNHIDQFDFAIKRPGRFDLIIQIMPPTFDSKMKSDPEIESHLKSVNVKIDTAKQYLSPLTYLEFKEFSKSLVKMDSRKDAMKLLKNSLDKCTLNQTLNNGSLTWEEECKNQRKYIRIPSV